MKIRLTRPATVSGVPFPAGFEGEFEASATEFLLLVGGAVKVDEQADVEQSPRDRHLSSTRKGDR